jgi:hypothetical protein
MGRACAGIIITDDRRRAGGENSPGEEIEAPGEGGECALAAMIGAWPLAQL